MIYYLFLENSSKNMNWAMGVNGVWAKYLEYMKMTKGAFAKGACISIFTMAGI